MNAIEVKEHLYYDPTTVSCLRWATDRRSGRNFHIVHAHKDSPAGNLRKDTKYFEINLFHKTYKGHRLVWMLFNGDIPDAHEVDHIDRNKLNNRIENLRCVPKVINLRNRDMQKNNASGVTGVSLNTHNKGQQWIAYWKGVDGSQNGKGFAVLKYGYEAAFKMACDWRTKMLAELNAQGAGYTEGHGLIKPTETSSVQLHADSQAPA